MLGLVLDGSYANQRTASMLGCSLDGPDFTPSFQHPSTNQEVHVIFDPCHMLKLVRNFFGDIGTLIDSRGGVIQWQYLVQLHRVQEEEGLHAANKLRASHLSWRRQIMKVRLAAQTLSRSVADALDFMRCVVEDERFRGSHPTSSFLRVMDGLFDRLNASNPLGLGSKSPWSAGSIDHIVAEINNAMEYLSSLKLPSGQLVIHSRRRTAITGFKCAAAGIIAIARHLLCRPNNPYAYFLPYKCSQDHIEILFSVLRRRSGWNNNPNVYQVKNIFVI